MLVAMSHTKIEARAPFNLCPSLPTKKGWESIRHAATILFPQKEDPGHSYMIVSGVGGEEGEERPYSSVQPSVSRAQSNHHEFEDLSYLQFNFCSNGICLEASLFYLLKLETYSVG
ncbi:collagen alpha-1(X) chain [Platysternon megacephalum]|uniref:Collagen alpha-1(X) chain n=1 Tax=Platysternon megacephalum TaxID=55544 RepID=A0A4D9FAL0_9SAUR|nr:collagen alpha-1(X) chain [Platysternon megacephalum]